MNRANPCLADQTEHAQGEGQRHAVPVMGAATGAHFVINSEGKQSTLSALCFYSMRTLSPIFGQPGGPPAQPRSAPP